MKNHVSAALLCVFIILLTLSYPAPGGTAPADSTRAATSVHPALWMQAVQVFDLNKNLVPGKANQKILELDDKGGAKSTTDVEISLALDPAGKIKSEIVKASKNGKDITAEERKKAAEREKKAAAKKAASKKDTKKDAKKDDKKGSKGDSDEDSHSFSLGDGPFDPEIQNDVRVMETNARETIGERICLCYEYAYREKPTKSSKGKPATVKGKAWLEEGTGNPVKIEFTSDPLPKGVKSMSTTLVYGPEGEDAWILKQMTFEARASFLVIKKRIHGDISFSDYWKYEEPAPQK